MQIVSVSDTKVTISNLMPSTTYTIEVSAVNSAGIGPYYYSDPVTTETGTYMYSMMQMNLFEDAIFSDLYTLQIMHCPSCQLTLCPLHL